jgi:hypothetical protein
LRTFAVLGQAELFRCIHALYNFILPFLSSKIILSNRKIALFNLIFSNRFFKYDLFSNMHYEFLNMPEMTHIIFLTLVRPCYLHFW